MNLVALDAATRHTGVSIWSNGKMKEYLLLDYDFIQDTNDRVAQMSNAIWDLLNKYKPTVVYIEDTYCGNNPHTQTLLNRIQGVTYAWCLRHNAKFVCIKPSSWRKYIDGFPNGKGVKRDEQKKYSVKYVAEKYKIECNDDVADAILIGEAANQIDGGR